MLKNLPLEIPQPQRQSPTAYKLEYPQVQGRDNNLELFLQRKDLPCSRANQLPVLQEGLAGLGV